MLRLINKEGTPHPEKELAPQARLEMELAKVVNLGNIECIYLFSKEGLLLAGIQGRSDFTVNQALEIYYSVNDGIQFIQNSPDFKGVYEVLIVSNSRRKIVIRTFQALLQQVNLVLVIPKGRTYRSHTNRLIRTIQKISRSVLE